MPEINFITFLIVCPLVGLAGFIDAIAGGGGLISLPAYMAAGLPPQWAKGTNKMSSCMGTTISTIEYGKKGYIKVKYAIGCAIVAVISSYLGVEVSLLISDKVFKIIMLAILPFLAVYVLLGKRLDNERQPFDTKKTIIISLPIAFVIGFYDGFLGPGTGTFLMLALTGLAHMSLNDSAGITKVINLTTNVTSIITYMIKGYTIYLLGLCAGIFGIIGNYLGAKLFINKGTKFVKPMMIVVLTLLVAKIVYDIVTGE